LLLRSPHEYSILDRLQAVVFDSYEEQTIFACDAKGFGCFLGPGFRPPPAYEPLPAT